MNLSLKKLSTAMMFGCVTALGIGSAGCEGVESAADQADRRVSQAVDQAVEQMRHGDAAGATATVRPIQQQQADASAIGKIRAHAILADADLAQATEILQELDAAQVSATTLAWEIDQLVDRMRAAALAAESYQSLNPQETQQQITQATRAVQGGPDNPIWFEDPEGDGGVPSLSQLEQTISRLQGEISRRRQQIEQLTNERREINEQAQATFARANELQGQDAVDVFREGTELRHKAATVAIQIEQINHELAPLNSDLSIAEAQRTILQQTITNNENQNKALAESWQQVEQQIDQQQSLARRIAGNGQPAEGEIQTISQKADQLANQINAAWEMRQRAHSLLESAINHAETAASTALQLDRTLTDRGRTQLAARQAFDTLRTVHDPDVYRLTQLNAQQQLASSWASHASLLSLRQQVAQRVEEVAKLVPQLQVPQSLAAGDLNQQVQTARQAMTERFQQAVQLAEDIIEAPGASVDQRNAAGINKALTLHAWAVALRNAGDTQAAQARITEARAALPGEGAVLPPLPAEIRTNAPGATPAPAPAPQNEGE